jgi:hypothetical protein
MSTPKVAWGMMHAKITEAKLVKAVVYLLLITATTLLHKQHAQKMKLTFRLEAA